MPTYRYRRKRSRLPYVLLIAALGVGIGVWIRYRQNTATISDNTNSIQNVNSATIQNSNESEDAPLQNTNTQNVNTGNTNAPVNNNINSANTNAAPLSPAPTSHAATSKTEIVHGDTTKKQIIFTFDAGAGTQSLDGILAALAKHHVRGTFFVTGKWVEKNTDALKKIAGAGHEIYNHTYSHPHLPILTDAQILEEFSKTDTLVKNATGHATPPYFRAPYGDRNAHVLDVAFQAGYQSIYWTTDALDWEESTGKTAAQVKDRILSNLTPGAIILMHVGDTLTAQVLDDVFTQIEKQGYTLVSLSEGVAK